jgi:hypothetical protein
VKPRLSLQTPIVVFVAAGSSAVEPSHGLAWKAVSRLLRGASCHRRARLGRNRQPVALMR